MGGSLRPDEASQRGRGRAMISALEQYESLRAVEFGEVFMVGRSGMLYRHTPSDVYAPEVFHSETDDVEVGAGWEPLIGYTGQYGYNGAVMHSSEYLGGRLADDILSTPGVYALVVVEVLTEDGLDDEPAGWAVVRRIED